MKNSSLCLLCALTALGIASCGSRAGQNSSAARSGAEAPLEIDALLAAADSLNGRTVWIEGVGIVRPFMLEIRDRSCLGLLSARDGSLYALRMPGYRVERVGLPHWNPEREQLTIFGNPIDWTIRIASQESERYYAVSADDLRTLDSFERHDGGFVLPGLHFTSPLDRYVRPRFGR